MTKHTSNMEYMDIRRPIRRAASQIDMKRVEKFLTALLQLTMTFSLANSSAATCLEEQVSSCRQAALESKVGEMQGGGECKASSYVHYTHECRVQDYLPSIDFCCCQLDAKVMCCRYHQGWDRFRCSEADDTIDQAQPSMNLPLPLELFVPAVVGPVLLAACCIFCCAKCLCHRHYADEEDAGTDCFSCCACSSKSCSRCCDCGGGGCGSCGGCSGCSSCCKDDDERGSRHGMEKNGAPSADEHEPLNYQNFLLSQNPSHHQLVRSSSSMEGGGSSSNGSSHSKPLLHHMSSSSSQRVEPTAPPSVLMDNVFLHGDYGIYSTGSLGSGHGGLVANNNPVGLITTSPCSNNINTSTDCTGTILPTTAIYSSPQHALCASCSNALMTPPPPPPTYEESEGQKMSSSPPTSPVVVSSIIAST